ncbi:UDP-N-acetylmuramoyl-L-alanine--D-glutamate ligase [Kordiimonas marina]|uniref:UDP-N-acetylmuramoyl-L-alanine--D-glutamate ligase n=1 Tax=Kordiimonas marina TaxID=2872312 RepID=UPI001FF33C60|nr:UDP-N-acetylmuramoyl-L-alanine--D-glutamate ligase [Kordiimonas marina]MCJ9429475.1 UDP-N-acetylmuramoyl-L-alanine--D-glutamate ligase [Kordiimonas marina]
MITASAYKGKDVGVFGLARTGLAAVEALKASGAHVHAWDDNVDRQKAAVPHADDLYALDFKTLDALMLAPGVPLTHPEPHTLVKKAQGAGVPTISDFDVFEAARAELPAHKTVAVTGTNGKSTTTALIGHMVAACGRPAAIGGNIGTGILSLDALPEDGVYVFEMSSFQIDLTRSFTADIAILLNITPDHLDRHGDMAGYVAAKRKLFDMQRPGAAAIIGVDDAYGAAIAAELGDRAVPVSVMKTAPSGIYVTEDGMLIDDRDGTATAVGSIAGLTVLRGRHNWQNAAVAYGAGRLLGFAPEAILAAFESFPGLAHRQEVIATIDGVRYVNDSKATNVDAAERALGSFRSILWIAGGRPKDKSFDALAAHMGNVKRAYLIGEAADAIASGINGHVDYIDCHDLAHALELARADAADGDTVLLSPACPAFDQFRDFEHRGATFRALVEGLMKGADA